MKPKHRFFHSYTSRLALLYAIIFSASTLFLFYFFYLFTASYMTRQVDDTIQTEIRGLAERYDDEGLEGLTTLIADRISRQQTQATGNSIYLLTTYTFLPLAGNLDRWPKNATVDDDWIEFSLVINQETNEAHLARARIFRLPGRYGLLVGRDIHQLTEAKRRIVQALTWGLAIMVLLASAGGLLLGRRTARKIERINQTTRSIMSGDLSRRVPLTNHNDDFDQVAENLNQMLDRIQGLMEDIRRVSDSIAHDLRTPLARLRQHLEEARQQENPNSGRRGISKAPSRKQTRYCPPSMRCCGLPGSKRGRSKSASAKLIFTPSSKTSSSFTNRWWMKNNSALKPPWSLASPHWATAT